MYTITFTNLTEQEAAFLGDILRDYRADSQSQKLESYAEAQATGNDALATHITEWYDGHIKLYDNIMSKGKWSNESY